MNLPRLLFPLILTVSSLHAQTNLKVGGIDFVLISKGSFTQGSPADEPGREADETQRQVTISKDFYMSVTPVTRGQWDQFTSMAIFRTEAERGHSGGYGLELGKLVQASKFSWRDPGFEQEPDDPVVIVTWDDAQAFCRWFSTVAKRKCSLPTEAQWEYACRAGTTTARYAGPLSDVAWYRGNCSAATHRDGNHQPNPWGLVDMYGPVWQWCEDVYAPYEPGDVVDPLQRNRAPGEPLRRVLRGGSFMSDASHSRSAERYRNDPKSRNADNGFRIVLATEVTEARVSPAPPVSHVAPSSAGHTASTPSPSAPGFGVSIFSGLLSCLFPLVILFFVIKALVRKLGGGSVVGDALKNSFTLQGNSGGVRAGAPRFTTRIVDDGFWINGPTDAVGQRIAYECLLNGMLHRDQVNYTPGPEGHFIFTGSRPDRLAMQMAGAVIGDELVSQSFDDDRTRWSSTTHRSSNYSSSSSFPPAY